MSSIITLIGASSKRNVTPDLLRDAMACVSADDFHWLNEGVAADIVVSHRLEKNEICVSLKSLLAGHPVDIVVQDASPNRKKKLLIADMDSTMIEQECIDELAGHLGVKDQVAGITARAMNGEIDFEPALRERVALLEGLPVSALGQVMRERITLAPGAEILISTMRAHGAYTALVSGGFTFFTGSVTALLGFDEHRANVLIEKDGVLTGKVQEPILGSEDKLNALNDLSRTHGLAPSQIAAVGDGANDLAMLCQAGLGVALHAKPAVAKAAPFRIDNGDLTALLYIQGIKIDGFSFSHLE